ncbi:hypothetical protein [Candidatus Paracaedibacter symbiosus]|uniref:hypothetical protein n=1 Tax=Candidatus Paracaedibacter symbiosus TaxID=244582 RepID=UPI000509636C|nr:hypothetical protein [Candidatus Paracaedibacter symbiosus]
MALVAARNIKFFLLRTSHPGLSADEELHQFTEACKYFDSAIRLRLQECDEGMCDERMKDKFINILNAISQQKLTGEDVLNEYERILEQLGLGDHSTSLNSV